MNSFKDLMQYRKQFGTRSTVLKLILVKLQWSKFFKGSLYPHPFLDIRNYIHYSFLGFITNASSRYIWGNVDRCYSICM